MFDRGLIEEQGIVISSLGEDLWLVELGNGYRVKAFVGKFSEIKKLVCVGNEVVVRLTTFDLTAARVVRISERDRAIIYEGTCISEAAL